MEKKLAIGIDLGLSSSVVAVYQEDGVHIVANKEGNSTTPSYVAFTEEAFLVGEEAFYQAWNNPKNTIFDTKRLIGCEYEDNDVQKYIRNWPFQVIKNNGQIKIVVEYKRGERTFFPEEISSMVLAKLKQTVEDYVGTEIKDVVITVPAYFSNNQRLATRDAAQIADLNVIRMINEPTAVAMAYFHSSNNKERKNVLIYDLRRSTFDVTVLLVKNKDYRIRGISGDSHLGGEDFDTILVKHFVEKFKRKYGQDISVDKSLLLSLRTHCERAKCILSSCDQAKFILQGTTLVGRITRARFEGLCNELFEKSIILVNKAIKDTDLNKNEIHDVILAGGSSRIPKIQKLLSEYFEGKQLKSSINPEECVAYGAAIQAAMLQKDESAEMKDAASPFSLRVDLVDGSMAERMHTSFFEQAFLSEEYSDCSFIFPNEEGQIIKGHRLVLAAALQTFRELFEDAQNQKNEGCVIEIKDVKSTVYKNFIRFLYCKTIDLSFGELVEMYEVFRKYNYEVGKSYLVELFSREKPKNSNLQGFIQLLEFAFANNDQSLLELSSKKLLIDYNYSFGWKKIPQKLFDKAIRCLLSDETLKEKPVKLLNIFMCFIFVTGYSSLCKEGAFDETLELFCWEKISLSDILQSLMGDDQKVKFSIRSIDGNSTKQVSPTKDCVSSIQVKPDPIQIIPNLMRTKGDDFPVRSILIDNSVAEIGSSYTKQTHTDCKFEFPNGKTLKAHKLTLSLASPVFEAMFYGDLKEGDSVKIVDVEEPVFDLLLKIIYLIDVDLGVEPSRTIYDLYAVAHKYQCLDGLNLIREEINTRRSDAFLFYELSKLYDDKAIEQKCLESLKDPLYALETDFFLDASPQTICTVYKANTVNSVSGTKQLVEKLQQYIEMKKQANPKIEFQIQEAFKGIRIAELEIIDILKTSLLASNEKVIMVAVKLNVVNPRKVLCARNLNILKFSSYDQEIFNRGQTLGWFEMLHVTEMFPYAYFF